ncbi:hypothetical protein NDU88_006431 [Pleurodeles waltl]|uniref:Integrase catalytic domain-containing protein n=1 Tax=Pleurodeles waltl TaxID=8319 RepID=A0AAV7MZH0_PLEWA|nr:hypothetical protein NDU88_006431 [Pleurodeles waltl]
MMVVNDYFSPEVEILDMTTAARVNPCFEKVMDTHGIFQELHTDNGVSFSSQEFADYLALYGIAHPKITTYWLQDNGEAERFMRTLKVLRTAVDKSHNNDCALYAFLREYRLTPLATTQVPPSSYV